MIVGLAWLVLVFSIPSIRFVILAPSAKAGVEVILALASLFGALVLLLFPAEGTRMRFRWVAAGFLVLGVGGLLFGYLYPLLIEDPNPNGARYASLMIQTAAAGCFTGGLALVPPRRMPKWGLILVLIGALALSGIAYQLAEQLPRLAGIADIKELERAAAQDTATMQGLTVWHWILSLIPLSLAVIAAIGAAWRLPRDDVAGWLPVVMALLAAAQLHAMFWPAGYSPALLTTASLLRLALTLVVVVGAVLELRRIAAERSAMLAAEQEYSRRLVHLARLRADFTSMVAHELNSPVAAIRRFADMIAIGNLAAHQTTALEGIELQVQLLTSLVADVEASAAVERDNFVVQLRPVPLEALITDARIFAASLPGKPPCSVSVPGRMLVHADPERIAQVLRNLLSNAANYSSDGTPIEIRSDRVGSKIRISVRDRGYGIHPEDLERVFEKFGQGRNEGGERVAGAGLGLYLSRRIIQAHGSDLQVHSELGVGSEFSFELDVVE